MKDNKFMKYFFGFSYKSIKISEFVINTKREEITKIYFLKTFYRFSQITIIPKV